MNGHRFKVGDPVGFEYDGFAIYGKIDHFCDNEGREAFIETQCGGSIIVFVSQLYPCKW